MKIRKGAAVTDARDAVRDARRKSDQHLLEQINSGNSQRRKRLEESEVDVSLGQMIKSQLGVEQLQAERRAKVEELKELVQSGKYNPSSEAIAQAVGQEIAVEIAQSQSFFQDGEAE